MGRFGVTVHASHREDLPRIHDVLRIQCLLDRPHQPDRPRTGLVEPTVRGAAGSGSQRLYGFRDILVLKLVKRLLDTGISLQQIRVAVNQLRESGINDLAQTTLMSDGASVYLCTSSDEVIDLVSRGQGVFGIAVGKVLREVEHDLVELDSVPGEDPMDELARRRAIKAS